MLWFFHSIGIVSNRYAFPPPVFIPRVGKGLQIQGSNGTLSPTGSDLFWISKVLSREPSSGKQPNSFFSQCGVERLFSKIQQKRFLRCSSSLFRDGARASSTSSRGSLRRDPVQKPAGPSCVSPVLSSEGCPSRILFFLPFFFRFDQVSGQTPDSSPSPCLPFSPMLSPGLRD